MYQRGWPTLSALLVLHDSKVISMEEHSVDQSRSTLPEFGNRLT